MPETRRRRSAHRCDPATQWTVTPQGIVLLNPRTGAVRRLDAAQAAIWDLCAHDWPPAVLLELVGAALGVSLEDARPLIIDLLETARREGFLLPSLDEHGEPVDHLGLQ